MELNLQNKRVRFYVRATSSVNQHRQKSDLSLFAQGKQIDFYSNLYFDRCDSNSPRPELNRALQEAQDFDILVILHSATLHIDSEFADIYENVFNDKGVQVLKLSQIQMQLEASS